MQFTTSGKAITPTQVMRDMKFELDSKIKNDAYIIARKLDIVIPEIFIRTGLRGGSYAFRARKLTLGIALGYNRTSLVHEMIHALKIRHDGKARIVGFYSRLDRDTLSPKVEEWIFNGGKKPLELIFLINVHKRRLY